MKNLFAVAAFAAAVGTLGAPASADDAMNSSSAMMKADPTMATLLCRSAMTGEKPTAMMGSVAIVCKNIDKDKMNAMKASLMSMPGGEPLYLKMFQEYHIGQNGVGG